MAETTHVRVDNRLLHGQVVQFWLPYLEIDHLVIADDDAASNPAMLAVYRMAIPKQVKLSVVTVADLRDELKASTASTMMILLGDVMDVHRARINGCVFERLTLGNIHSAQDRMRITDAVYLSQEEIDLLVEIRDGGTLVEIQTFPGDSLRLVTTKDGETKWSKS